MLVYSTPIKLRISATIHSSTVFASVWGLHCVSLRCICAVLYMYMRACMCACMEEAGSWTNIPSCLSFLRYVLCKHRGPHYKLLARDLRRFRSLVFTEYPSQILSAWCQCSVCTVRPERTAPMRTLEANGPNIGFVILNLKSTWMSLSFISRHKMICQWQEVDGKLITVPPKRCWSFILMFYNKSAFRKTPAGEKNMGFAF